MPPVRTMPAKPLKTERTHEENQERAYIAASRRSDRSLEARMESARRASEIHKKRTGRALRVTEQDVVNEEMYEEEDEDLDAQIRRLTSHMANASPDFSRRIHSLLTAQSAMRLAYHNNNQYSNGASFAPNQYIQNMETMQMQNLQYSQQMQHMQQQQMQAMQNMQGMQNMSAMQNMPNMNTINPHMMAAQLRQPSMQNMRHAPYPMMNQAMRQQSHQRSASMASGNQGNQMMTPSPSPATPSGLTTEEQRRLSLPASARPSLSRNASSVHTIKTESPGSALKTSRTPSPASKDGASPKTDAQKGVFYSVPTTPVETKQTQNALPLTSALPTESQIILGPHLDASDPRTNVLMAGSTFTQQQFFDYNSTPSMKPQNSQFNFNGMNQTLGFGMSMLDTSTTDFGSTQSGNHMMSASTDDYSQFSPNNDDTLFDSAYIPSTNISRNNSSQGFNAAASKDDSFDNWINSDSFADNAVNDNSFTTEDFFN